jgi:hypothetical protein
LNGECLHNKDIAPTSARRNTTCGLGRHG